MNYIVAAILSVLAVVYFILPPLIKIAQIKDLGDRPNLRSSHLSIVPYLGGLGIFIGLITSVLFWIPEITTSLKYLLCAVLAITVLGLQDDIVSLSPYRKLMVQTIIVGTLIYCSEIYISTLFGLFGIYEIPYFFSFLLTLVFMLAVVNGFNLIDGINGLAAGIALVCSAVLGGLFYWHGMLESALVALALAGALVAFLPYNITPAKIFLGDSGSLLIGLLIAFLSVQLLADPRLLVSGDAGSAPVMVFAILIIPLYDTSRVFFLRLLKGRSPLRPDKNHIHHRLIQMGWSHTRASLMLVLTNIFFIVVAWLIRALALDIQFVLLLGLALLFNGVLIISRKGHHKNQVPDQGLAVHHRPGPSLLVMRGDHIKSKGDKKEIKNY